MSLNRYRRERLSEAYVMMASNARYRPQAPGDGCGHVNLTQEQADDPQRLRQEAFLYAQGFDKEEDNGTFTIGCSDGLTNRAFVWTIEAARKLAAGLDGEPVALKLLKMAVKELEQVRATPRPL